MAQLSCSSRNKGLEGSTNLAFWVPLSLLRASQSRHGAGDQPIQCLARLQVAHTLHQRLCSSTNTLKSGLR